ncbi:gustatory receptor 8a-like isoform X6 [Musca domestica]|uniref:Gustatory receptor n=1 Tax=Musca domestica TaxID=7370 RepID=A0A9J7DDU4_MUSDO|nr:gustatory receptor 8a-like isoform X6 [Musca domestica]
MKYKILCNPLRILLHVFYYMGLSTYISYKVSPKWQRLRPVKLLVIHLLIIAFLIIMILQYKYDPPYHDNFGKFYDILKFVVLFAVHLLTLLETIITGQHVCEFFHLYYKLNKSWFKSSRPLETIRRTYWKLFCYLGFSLVLTVAIEINYLVQIRKKRDWLVFFSSYTPSIFVCRCRIPQLVMYLELIRMKLLQLNQKIQQYANGTKKVQLKFFENFIYNDLTQWAKVYEDIYETSVLVSRSMPVSILAIFVATYVKILSDCYWSYWVIYAKFELHEIFECSLLLPSVLNILLVLVVSKNCMRTIQHFSLQICHQQIIFKAFGCFTIDCYIASGILGSIATYMMFYIQFMPKFNYL